MSTAVREQEVRLDDLRVHLAQVPSSQAGVLLYPTIFGLNDSMRRLAKAFAEAGFTAAVWDPYNGEDGSGDFPEMFARSKLCEDERVVEDLRIIVDYMLDECDLTFVGAAGWCFGGRIALLHAGVDHRVKALCAYNPTMISPTPVTVAGHTFSRADFPCQTMDEFALATAVQGPVQVSRPGRDFTQAAEYDRLIEALYSREDPTFYEYYPNAEHGFSYMPGDENERAHRFAWAGSLTILNAAAAPASR